MQQVAGRLSPKLHTSEFTIRLAVCDLQA